jgi:hypothetical protein
VRGHAADQGGPESSRQVESRTSTRKGGSRRRSCSTLSATIAVLHADKIASTPSSPRVPDVAKSAHLGRGGNRHGRKGGRGRGKRSRGQGEGTPTR